MNYNATYTSPNAVTHVELGNHTIVSYCSILYMTVTESIVCPDTLSMHDCY